MGTTINGVFKGGVRGRREKALTRLKEQEAELVKEIRLYNQMHQGKVGETRVDPKVAVYKEVELTRIKKEISNLEDKLSGKKKVKIDEKGKVVVEAPKEKWFIDIYQIHLGYVKNSERRKNKGKSRKKMKKVRSTSFVKSVILQPGMLTAFREGRMGISPKNHSFRTRKDEPSYFN